MKNVCIVGIQGNMGRRYKAVLDYLGVGVMGIDVGFTYNTDDYTKADGFIVATPTATHMDFLNYLSRYDKPILIEKPIVIGELDQTFEKKHLVTLVNQYAYLVDSSWHGDTYFDYFKTGGDGLAWDCISILGLSEKRASLNNGSPIWKCAINGKELNIADMDTAYIKMVADWIKNKESNWAYAVKAHKKVLEWLRL
jgi:hypothetical protein